MITPLRTLLAGFAAASLAAPAFAAPLSITESTDFSNSAPGTLIGTLDVGVNTISGHVGIDLADYFQLSLPDLLGVTDVVVSFSDPEAVYTSGGVTNTEIGVSSSFVHDLSWFFRRQSISV